MYASATDADKAAARDCLLKWPCLENIESCAHGPSGCSCVNRAANLIAAERARKGHTMQLGDPKISIPEKHQAFCREIAAVCRKHGLYRFTGSYDPWYNDEWSARIDFSWEQGRHGEDSDKVNIQSNVRVCTKIGPEQ